MSKIDKVLRGPLSSLRAKCANMTAAPAKVNMPASGAAGAIEGAVKHSGGILGDIMSLPGKALHALGTPKGIIGLDLFLNSGKILDQIAPKAMAQVPKFASDGRNTMRTLKDVLIEKIAAAKAPMEKRASLPFSIGDADVEFFTKIAAAPREKQAGWLTEAAQSAMPTIQTAGLGLMGASVASGLYDRASDYLKRNAAYDQMFQEFPALNEVPREQVDKFWNVLNDFAPKLTTNPLVAGQFVENMLNYGIKGVDHNVAGQLLQTEAHAQNAGGRNLNDLISMLGKSSFDAGVRDMVPSRGDA